MITLKATSAFGNPLYNKNFFIWIEEVNRLGEGRVFIDYIGGPEIASWSDQFEALRTGIADISNHAPSYMVGEVLEGDVLSAVKPGAKYQIEHFFQNEEVRNIIKEVSRAKAGVVPVGIGLSAGAQGTLIFGKWSDGLPTLDLTGFKIRAHSIAAEAVEKLGGASVWLPASERYDGMQRGIIDGVTANPRDLYDGGEFEVYKYIMRQPIWEPNTAHYISADAWDTLPEDVQRLLDFTGRYMEIGFLWERLQSVQEAIDYFVEEEGTVVFDITPETERKLAQLTRAAYLEKIRDESEYGARLYLLLKDHTGA